MNRMFLLLLMMSGTALAQAPDTTTPAAYQFAGTDLAAFGDLKYRALEAEARMETVLHPGGAMPSAGARLYVGNAAATFDLKRLLVSIDGGAPVSVPLDGEETSSLTGTSDLLWLRDFRIAKGSHEVHAEMQVADPSQPGHPVQQFAADTRLEVESAQSGIEITLAPASLMSAAHIELVRHDSDGGRQGWLTRTVRSIGSLGGDEAYYSPGRGNDPAMRYVRHLLRVGQGDAAVIELLGISLAASDQGALPAGFWLELSSALRVANLPDQAQAVCDRLDAQRLERQAVGVERLRIGMLHYQSGDTAKAEAQLLSARGRLPEYRVQDWQVAYAQILFDRNQVADARGVLQSGNVDSIDAYRYMNDSMEAVRTSAYRRFNLAVAMVQSGDEVKGLSLLDLVGRLKGSDSDLLALRDKANLTLGWHFLQAKQGATAMGILGRVRSEGRYSSKALLGMGWAQLAPAGEKLARVRLVDDIDNGANPLPAPLKNSLTQLGVLEPEMRGEVGPKNFTQDKPPVNRQDALERALGFWNLLAQRDAGDTAVQEGLLAIAYAFDDLGDSADARVAYARAIAALEAQKRDLAARSAYIHTADFAGAVDGADRDAQLALLMDRLHLSPGDALRPLYARVDRYRELGRLRQQLSAHQAAVSLNPANEGAAPDVPALLTAIDAVQRSDVSDIQALAQDELDQQGQRIDEYLKVAYFAAARANDSTLEALR